MAWAMWAAGPSGLGGVARCDRLNSKMSKTEYDLKAIMYSAYDTPHKLFNKRGYESIRQFRLPPNNAGKPMRQFKSPLASLGSSGEPGSPVFPGGGGNVRGAQSLTCYIYLLDGIVDAD